MRALITYLLVFLWLCLKSQNDSIVIIYTPEDTTRINVTRLSVNSDKSDFSPLLQNNSLLFVSARQRTTGIKYSGYEDENEITDLYTGNRKDSVSFKVIKPVQGNINTKYSEGPFSLSNDGNTLYYTGNAEISRKHRNRQSGLLKIYSSRKIDGVWEKGVPVPFCENDFSYCHPCLSPDGNSLFFCSNMPGGFGAMDIYMTHLENGVWTKPVNLGPKINTAASEVFPFMSQSGTLYFSSQRSNGMGGLDLYSFDMNDPFENETLLLEYPLNSAADDFGIWTDSSGTSGYFSTNRIPRYGDDIYYFSTNIPDFSKAKVPVFKNKFCYTFFEETAVETNDSTGFLYEWDFGDGTKSNQLKTRHCFHKPGTYNVRLNAIDKNNGEVFSDELSYELVIDEPPKLYVNCPDTVSIGSEIIINSEKSYLEGYELNKTYWLFGDGRYNSGKYVKHIYNKPGKFVIQLGVYAKDTKTSRIEKFKINKEVYVKEKF